jgi:hypothetical protein
MVARRLGQRELQGKEKLMQSLHKHYGYIEDVREARVLGKQLLYG